MLFSPLNTGIIKNNIYAIRTRYVNAFLYIKNENFIMIDTGLNKKELKRGFEALNIDPRLVTHVFLTHSDYDHVGGLDLLENVQIYLSHTEEQMTNKTTPRSLGFYYNPAIKRKYNLLKDGDTVYAGITKVTAISTPGHTPGSMSYFIDDRFLFTGDTVLLKKNKASSFYKFLNMKTKKQGTIMQIESIKKLISLKNISMLFTAHTGYTSDFYKDVITDKKISRHMSTN